ncbi:MAG: SufB/SufD family protein [Acidimicrobiales bacterium]
MIVSMSLLPDAVITAELGGADWLVARRRDAADRLTTVEVPDGESEVWRYSPIGRLELAKYTTPAERTDAPAVIDPAGAAARIEIANGRVVGLGVDDGATAAGLEVVLVRDLANAPFDRLDADEYVGVLAESLTSDPILIRTRPGATVDGPVVIDHIVDEPGRLVATMLVVRAGADSDLTVVERRRSGTDEALVVPFIDLEADAAARLHYVDAQLLGNQTWQLGQQHARVGAQSTLTMHQAGLGGAYARMRTDCVLAGRGATGNLSAAYLGGDDQILDYRTFQDHAAPDTTSELLFKGAVDDESRSIYSGLIRVRPDARGTVAYQTNRNIKLAETAWAESVPNLEIENNDVRCSHASTVGPIDEDQRFYLESRGVPPAEAEHLILAGFFLEVLADFPDEGLAAELIALIADRLEGVHSS